VTADLERVAAGAVDLTTRALAQASAGLELTFPQWRALVVIGTGDDGARIGEIAAAIAGTLPATGRLVRRLERRGLATLGPDPDDRRATRARLTGRGREVRSGILAHRRRALAEVVRAVPATDRTGLAHGLRAIADELERRPNREAR
jgi:DNA-binding MarR family transcriptional regulator